ncbi:hypothetical protein VTK56DRAFT_7015 [Thermocarpiscus australiensis]
MSSTWSPPEDPDKPPCPYRENFMADIRCHRPPAPFGPREYPPRPRPAADSYILMSMKQTEAVVAYPPVETAPLPAPRAARMTITEELAVADGRGAQLAVCTVEPKDAGQKPFQAVAKIYDALYYFFPYKEVPTDRDYSCEAAAYEHLDKVDRGGSFAPQYFGSWTFTIPIRIGKETKQRSVRLILIEHLRGPSIRDLCRTSRAAALDVAYRLEIFARVLDGYVKQVHKGLDQRDLAPRNVVLVFPQEDPRPGTQPKIYPRVVLVDYNVSIIFDMTTRKIRRFPTSGALPPNPMDVFWGSKRIMQEFGGWVPPEWKGMTRCARNGWGVASEGCPVTARSSNGQLNWLFNCRFGALHSLSPYLDSLRG